MAEIKRSFITLYGPEVTRIGQDKQIDLVSYLPEYINNTDTEKLVEVFEEYLNEMYDGDRSYGLSAQDLDITYCMTSACSLSAVEHSYEHNSYIVSATSAISLDTPANDVKIIDLSGSCLINTKEISILEKIQRLTELVDPDYIPIELIQFYGSNLGFDNVDLSRDNVGYDYVGGNEEANQKKYLRFLMNNLSTWYEIKGTRSAIKLAMYSFGLVGDFVYYYTLDYMDKQGINSIDSLSPYLIKPGMSFQEIQEIKCILSQWEEFKYNRQKFWETLKALQKGFGDNWQTTNLNIESLVEDISDIPDNYFSTPHFKLYYDLEESGNYSIDVEKQNIIGKAILSIKAINQVFDGVTAKFNAYATLYVRPYVRTRKHLVLKSDGYADFYI
jgi:hypothetical protein